ncbi:MAG: YggS family pyridoxal phosphate-dependent enzyme [Chloroflexota bacterium]|nr:YggS family pyridoxal phosphate-dependent enzyme [Chloroflexota bacterium]
MAAHFAAVRARIDAACARAGRSPGDITLVAVTKTHPSHVIAAAFAAGLRDFGENRVQEAAPKVADLRERGLAPAWHLIGHLQRNKAAAAIDLFDILHSVDSIRLAETISAHASRPVRVLLEVNVTGELSKFGISPEETPGLAEHIGGMPNIALTGLMTVAPPVDDPEDARPVFRTVRQLRDAIGLRELSMGMTGDFEVAVEEGSTLVRVGRALFGARGEAGH